MKYLDLVLCRHSGGGKLFLFQAPFCSGLKKGDFVIVETQHGDTEATVVAVDSTKTKEDSYNFTLMCAGATHPLKKIIKRVVLEDVIYEGEEDE